jgi:hypothetical protein
MQSAGLVAREALQVSVLLYPILFFPLSPDIQDSVKMPVTTTLSSILVLILGKTVVGHPHSIATANNENPGLMNLMENFPARQVE